MYAPPAFQADSIPVLHAAIRQIGLAAIVTPGVDGLGASHVPVLLDPEPAPYGTLRGHIARANPQWRDTAPGTQALALFLGPGAYVSPGWYPTKRETGKVVPTWNYVAIHAHGPITFFDDRDRLLALVTRLTEQHEAGRPEPWAVDEAPADFIDAMLRGIVGFELPITRLEGAWKMSQNRTAEDRAGVARGLAEDGNPAKAAVAELVASPPNVKPT